MDTHMITLATKPGASLAVHTYAPDDPSSLPAPLSETILVFLNGLAAPQSVWAPTLAILLEHHKEYLPATVTYDRYGQGASDPDPTDPPDTPYGHDASAVVADLHELLTQLCRSTFHLPAPAGSVTTTRLLLVCSSIGCPLARLYAAAHPCTVSGLLFLDSMIANTDFVSLFPDPDAAGFDPAAAAIPAGVSVGELRRAREQYGRMFHPAVPNAERFDRRDMPRRLPHADKPALPPAGPGGEEAPLLTVVGHDFDKFAQDGLEGPMAIPKALTEAYMNPAWHAYNQGLCRLTTRQGAPAEPVIAPGCGHVIQRDSPEFVAEQVVKLLEALRDEHSARE